MERHITKEFSIHELTTIRQMTNIINEAAKNLRGLMDTKKAHDLQVREYIPDELEGIAFMLKDMIGQAGFMKAPNTHESREDGQRPVERLVIPLEILDLVRFMCATWTHIDKWAYENASGDALMKYPVIQGTLNQMNLHRIGEQAHDTTNIHKAVEWLLNEAV